MAFTLFKRWSPEYALNNAFEDMNRSGLDGLKKHLTSNALRAYRVWKRSQTDRKYLCSQRLFWAAAQ